DAFASGGSKKSPTTDAIAGTTDDAIYRSNRFGTGFSYNIPVKGGEYQVVLHFADLYWTAAGKRVFDVSIEGTKVLSAYDIVGRAGAAKTAATETFTVTVTDGTLNIAFARLVDNALVSAVEVIATGGIGTSSIASSSSKVVLEPSSPKNLEANVHPNPFDENIYLHLNSEKEGEEYEVKVYDVLGNTFYKESFKPKFMGENEFKISLQDAQLSPGVYLLYVVSKDKSFSRMFKVLKKP
ncbi:malectin domain-containing carbohydrate-binding protein, partial [Rufibacter hautae]|uniref:malectin domain-containing carbohydrate-binding protein n=1 Tax=Rufibacter hautae TaxID=2595005 RepID=UPI001680343B